MKFGQGFGIGHKITRIGWWKQSNEVVGADRVVYSWKRLINAHLDGKAIQKSVYNENRRQWSIIWNDGEVRKGSEIMPKDHIHG